MRDNDATTSMIHFECGVCDTTATCVDTVTAHLAWNFHMARHSDREDFLAWTWQVDPLPLG